MSSAHIHILGRLGRDPVTRQAGETTVCALAIAVDRTGRDQAGNPLKRTVWYEVDIWSRRGQTAAKHLRKGQRVYCHGTHDERHWTDAEGRARVTQQIKNADFAFADEPAGDAAGTRKAPAAQEGESPTPPANRPTAVPPAAANPDDAEPPF
jgi:single-strand DNA-binding protein